MYYIINANREHFRSNTIYKANGIYDMEYIKVKFEATKWGYTNYSQSNTDDTKPKEEKITNK